MVPKKKVEIGEVEGKLRKKKEWRLGVGGQGT